MLIDYFSIKKMWLNEPEIVTVDTNVAVLYVTQLTFTSQYFLFVFVFLC